MRKTTLLLVILCQYCSVWAQNQANIQDYNQAVGYLSENLYNKKVFNLTIKANWFPDNSGLWYIIYSPGKKTFEKISFDNNQKSPLFNHENLAQQLSKVLDKKIKAEKLPIKSLKYHNANTIEFKVKGKAFSYNPIKNELNKKLAKKKPSPDTIFSNNDKWAAFTKDYNLHIKSTETHQEKQLSHNGTKFYEYASEYGWADIIYGENGERPKQFFLDWSKNDTWIYTPLCDLRSANKMYLLNWAVDSLYKPQLLSYYRGSPGDTGMVYHIPVFFNTKTGKQLIPQLPAPTHINSTHINWSMNENEVYLYQQTRGYKNVKLFHFNLETENLDLLYQETSPTNIDEFTFRIIEELGIALILSEKSGWRQLYSLNLKSKKLIPLTQGAYYVDNIEYVDQANKLVYFTALGKENNRNPYHKHLYKIELKKKKVSLLTPENLNHDVSFSPNGKYFVDNRSSATQKTISELRDANTGKILAKISETDISRLNNWTPPEVFSVTGKDGVTPIYGALWKPTNFDASKKYPIIDHSYTGPHYSIFPNSFSRVFGNQALAELGFIVMCVDGLGTAKRSKAFHDYSYKNLGAGLVDHIGAIRQLSKNKPWIDTNRVGIYGHSAGGYDAAHALLAFPDFYKVAVSSSADHDHRMEKAWWPEMYMGWPVDSAYHLQSNITMAGNLKGKLLITHGGIDENVNPSATFKLAEALINSDKQFDLMIFPSQRHGYRGKHAKYFKKLRWNYFVEHLHGLDPIWDFNWK